MEDTFSKEQFAQYRIEKSMGTWHSPSVVRIGTYPSYLAGLMTGCGLMQMSNVTHINSAIHNNSITEEQLRAALKPAKQNGVGAVICTLGMTFYKYENNLLKCGFKKIAEYPNYRHSGDGSYTQRLYILTL